MTSARLWPHVRISQRGVHKNTEVLFILHIAMKISLLLLAVSISVPVWAQNPVTVRVLDEAGAPVVDAVLQAQIWDGEKVLQPTAKSDAEGNAAFSLPQKPDAKKTVGQFVVVAQGFAFASGRFNGETVEIRLEKGAVWRGKVVDEDGKPLEGAKVRVAGAMPPREYTRRVWLYGEAMRARFTAVSGADGAFQIADVPAKLGLHFNVEKAGFAAARGQDVLAASQTEIKLVKGAVLRGTLLDLEGKPLAKTRVFAQAMQTANYYSDGYGEATTDENGAWVMDTLAGGTYNVMADLPDDAPFLVPALQNTIAQAGKALELPAMRAQSGVLVRGVVRDSQTKTGLDKAGVGLYGPHRPSTSAAITSVLSNADGRFELRVLPGRNKIYLCSIPAGYLQNQDQKELEISAEAPPQNLIFNLQKAPKLRGVTVDETGKPISAALRFGYDGQVKSDANGKWETTLSNESEAAPSGDSDENGYFEVVSPQKLPKDEAEIRVVVRHKPYKTLAGRVVSSDGTPLEGVAVAATQLYPVGGDGGLSQIDLNALTDAQGRFSFAALRDGDAERVPEIKATKANFAFVSGGEVSKKDGNWSAAELILTPLNSVVEGKTAPGARVVAAGRETLAVADGSFRFEGLPNAGVMVFAAKDDKFGIAQAENGVKVEIELKKQGLQGVDTELARQIWEEALRDARNQNFYAVDWLESKVQTGGDTGAVSLQNALKAPEKNRDMAILTASEHAAATTDVAILENALSQIKDADTRLYGFLSAASKKDDRDFGIRALQEAQTILAQSEKQSWWREMNLYRAAVIADRFGPEKEGFMALNRAIAYTLKNHGAESEYRDGSQTKTGRDDMMRLQSEVVAGGSMALWRQLIDSIDPESGVLAQAIAEAIPAIAKRQGALAALPILDEILQAPNPEPKGERHTRNSQPRWAFDGAARRLIPLLGAVSPQKALELARRVESDDQKARALAAAAPFQTPEIAAVLWREAMALAGAQEAPRFAFRAWQNDPKLGEELFEIARTKAENEMKQGWQRGNAWAPFAFYYAHVQPAQARLILEKNWGELNLKKASGQELSIARAMSVIDGRRAWEMALEIPKEDKNFWSIETRRKIGQYLVTSEKDRANFPFDRWGATDTWDVGQDEW
jgi:hypothetical protein